jgi:transposase-like protein
VQSDHGVDFRGPARGEIARQKGDRAYHNRDSDDCIYVSGLPWLLTMTCKKCRVQMKELKGHIYHKKRKWRCPKCNRVRMQAHGTGSKRQALGDP